jgi:hypothetical protein
MLLARWHDICRDHAVSDRQKASAAAGLGLRLGCRLTAQDIRSADWSTAVQPFWGAVIRKALTPAGAWAVVNAGWATLKVRAVFRLGAVEWASAPVESNCAEVVMMHACP